jgi:hypothetical protein
MSSYDRRNVSIMPRRVFSTSRVALIVQSPEVDLACSLRPSVGRQAHGKYSIGDGVVQQGFADQQNIGYTSHFHASFDKTAPPHFLLFRFLLS